MPVAFVRFYLVIRILNANSESRIVRIQVFRESSHETYDNITARARAKLELFELTFDHRKIPIALSGASAKPSTVISNFARRDRPEYTVRAYRFARPAPTFRVTHRNFGSLVFATLALAHTFSLSLFLFRFLSSSLSAILPIAIKKKTYFEYPKETNVV